MILNVELSQFNIAFIKNSKEVLTNNEELWYNVNSKYNIDNMVLSVENGDIKREIKAKDGLFKVDSELLFAGRLKGTIRLFENNKVVKFWNLEPLVLSEHEKGVLEIPLIADLVNKVEELQKQVDLLIEEREKRDNVRKLFKVGK